MNTNPGSAESTAESPGWGMLESLARAPLTLALVISRIETAMPELTRKSTHKLSEVFETGDLTGKAMLKCPT